MEAVVRGAVASVNERIQTVNLLCLRVVIGQGNNLRIMLPKIRKRGSDIRGKPPWIPMVQITDRRCQHHDVAEREAAFENQLPHTNVSRMRARSGVSRRFCLTPSN